MSAAELWQQVITTHRMSQVHRDAMGNRALAPVFRDEAMVALTRDQDRLLELLDRLGEQQVLLQIGTHLKQRGS